MMEISSREGMRRRRKRIRRKKFINSSFYFTLLCLFIVYFGAMRLISLFLDNSFFVFNKPVEISFDDNGRERFSSLEYSDDPLVNDVLSLSAQYSNEEDLIRLNKVAENIYLYPDELLQLLFLNPDALSFVADYPDFQTGSLTTPSSRITDKMQEGFPILLQWDPIWGYESYGTSMIGLAGCAPTTLSMALMGILNDSSITPDQLAYLSQERGHITESNATSWSFFSDISSLYAVNCEEISLSESIIYNTLLQGKPIIVSMGPGDFTTEGHIILLTGVTENGEIIVNDPNSLERSSKTWNIEVFLTQSKNLWAIYQ